MMYPIHQKNRAILSVSAARSVKQASLFATEEEWLASVITQLGGEYPHRLMMLTRDIMTACDEADRQLNLESGSIAHDVLTEAQWADIFAAADAFSGPDDGQDKAQTKGNVDRAIRSTLNAMPRTGLETLCVRLHVAMGQAAPELDTLQRLTTNELLDRTFVLLNAYAKRALENYPAAVRAVGTHDKAALAPDERKRLARATTARMAAMPHYRQMLDNGEITLEQLAVTAYALVESRAMFDEPTSADPDDTSEAATAITGLIIAVLGLLLVALFVSDYPLMPVYCTIGICFYGLFALAGVMLTICSLYNMYSELLPAGLGETEPVYALRHAAAKLTNGAGNLLRDARNELADRPAVPHKVMVEPPRKVHAIAPA